VTSKGRDNQKLGVVLMKNAEKPLRRGEGGVCPFQGRKNVFWVGKDSFPDPHAGEGTNQRSRKKGSIEIVVEMEVS